MTALFHVVSPGGCGTHGFNVFMWEACGKHMADGWNSHRRDPNTGIPSPSRVLYLYADPFNTVLSFDRRSFLINQEHCRNMSGDVNGLHKLVDKSLYGYLDNGIDYFDLAGHVHGWMNFWQRKYDVMFVQYEHLREHLPDILKWWDLPPEKAGLFRWKDRTANWENESKETLEKLYAMYGSHREWYYSLDSKILKNRA